VVICVAMLLVRVGNETSVLFPVRTVVRVVLVREIPIVVVLIVRVVLAFLFVLIRTSFVVFWNSHPFSRRFLQIVNDFDVEVRPQCQIVHHLVPPNPRMLPMSANMVPGATLVTRDTDWGKVLGVEVVPNTVQDIFRVQ
jgi:hypothetical protein